MYQELDSPNARKNLEPLKLDSYKSVIAIEFEPCLWLSFSCGNSRVNFELFSAQKGFRVQAIKTELAKLPEVEVALRNECDFIEDGELLALNPQQSSQPGWLTRTTVKSALASAGLALLAKVACAATDGKGVIFLLHARAARLGCSQPICIPLPHRRQGS